MPMITAPVVSAVQQLLHERGITKRVDERMGDYVARGLDITPAQAETFIEALHEGKTLEQAELEAHITVKSDMLTAVARAVGTALGRISGVVG